MPLTCRATRLALAITPSTPSTSGAGAGTGALRAPLFAALARPAPVPKGPVVYPSKKQDGSCRRRSVMEDVVLLVLLCSVSATEGPSACCCTHRHRGRAEQAGTLVKHG